VSSAFKTEGVVLRSFRFGEADRIVHLYTSERGRIGALAKGVRRPLSRFGGRLEPFFRLELVLHQGRGELFTITQAETVHAHKVLRSQSASLERAAQAGEAVSKLFDTQQPSQPTYNLLCRELWLLDSDASYASRGNALAFRIKLLLVCGFLPELSGCAECGRRELEKPLRFSTSAGGLVCKGCSGDWFTLDAAAHQYMIDVLQKPLAQAPGGTDRSLGQVDRVVVDTLSYHAHIRLRNL
jgi:DNA repair protein RecO (recombination protein O)